MNVAYYSRDEGYRFAFCIYVDYIFFEFIKHRTDDVENICSHMKHAVTVESHILLSSNDPMFLYLHNFTT